MSYDDLVEISGGRKVTRADRDELTDLGEESANLQEAESAFKIATIFDKYGEEEKANELYSVGAMSVAYWEDTVLDLIGRAIYFNAVDSRWHDGVNNQYVKDPYLDVQMDDYDRYYSLLDKYG